MNNYIKVLLFMLTICNCYSMENNSIEKNNNKQAYTYYGMTTEELNKKSFDKFDREVHSLVEIILKHIIREINEIIQDKTKNDINNDINVVFKGNLQYEIDKVTKIFNEIKKRYKETLNTKDKILDITDLINEYDYEINDIEKLFKEYIEKNSKTFFHFKNYLKKNDDDIKGELLEFIKKRIDENFLPKLLRVFRTYYKQYHGINSDSNDYSRTNSDFDDWEIIDEYDS